MIWARWAVVFSNYFPREVDSTWWSKRKAEARADELNERDDSAMWEVVPA